MNAIGGISIKSLAGDVSVAADCNRSAKARERSIEITFPDGRMAALDFTQEPGVSTLDGAPLEPDPSWSTGLTPVMAEIREFFTQIALPARNANWAPLAENCLDSVTGAEILNDRLEILTASSRFPHG